MCWGWDEEPTMTFPRIVVLTCTIAGFVSVAIALGAAYAMHTQRQSRRKRGHRGARSRATGSLPHIVLLVSGVLAFFCAGLLVCFLESFPTHAWRHRKQVTFFGAVDAASGQPLPVEISGHDAPEDPFLVLEITWPSSDVAQVTWNTSIPILVSSDGYQAQTVLLTPDMPQRLAVPLTRSANVRPVRSDSSDETIQGSDATKGSPER